MENIFDELEDTILSNEDLALREEKIKDYILSKILSKLQETPEKERAFIFEDIVFNFFDYMNIPSLRTNKTRDLGIDGIIKINASLLGELNVGLQIKHKLVDSTDIDIFISALKNAELQLGVVVCKDARRLDKYELNNKIKAILLGKGIKLKERLINERFDITPVCILKLDDVINIISANLRAVARGIYKL